MLVKDMAKRDADDTRRANWGAILPIDPFAIARKMGLDIREASLKPGVSGMLIRDAGADPEIVLDIEDSPVRQNFTCAHELGHYIERTRTDPKGSFAFVDYRDGTTDDIHEFYANEFAGNLLMPAAAVKQLREREGLSAIEMASRFAVSVPAMRTRLKRLGLPER